MAESKSEQSSQNLEMALKEGNGSRGVFVLCLDCRRSWSIAIDEK